MGQPKGSQNCKECPAWKNSAFAGLSERSLQTLQEEKKALNYSRGDIFSKKGHAADTVYCLRSGSAKVTLVDESTNRESLVRLVEPGEMLGYRCIFSAEKYRGTASALTESVACKISKDVVFRLIEIEPKFSFELLSRMGREVANAEYHLHSFCQKNVRERLAEALLLLKDKFGLQTERGWKINTRLTRTELANWVGTSRETVIRTLTEFTQEGFLSHADDFLVLSDVQKLAQASGALHSDNFRFPPQKPLPRVESGNSF